jgi:hypothetical protein
MSENVRFEQLNPNQLTYLEWLATSKFERKPATEALLAKELGLNDRTLRRWKQLPGFRDLITWRAREILKDNLSEIYGALSREAIKGSYQHIKLALEATGEYTENIRLTGAGGGPLQVEFVNDWRGSE